MPKVPSPCISVCKFKRDGHCIGCSMTKQQKSIFKKLKKNSHREAYVDLVAAQQSVMGRYTHWDIAYRKKCAKKKVSLAVLNREEAA
ncbi:DUF1289 domain-containing protein [Phaeobacter sp.]|uniref:DUF1289 domain-containing protein n=1 Tax=Phaeobacter sp. TaxID=1902409 RepID=UPI0025E01FF5|nr:DUF1289 domain-containing protein [Phaeobacter sp.]